MIKRIGKNIKAVLFDHDDTLVGTYIPKSAQHKYIAKKHYGKDLLDSEIKLHWGKPLHELVKILYGTDDAEQALLHNKNSHEKFSKILFEETLQTLLYVHNKGKHIGIITATSKFSLERDMSEHKFPVDKISYLQTADDTDFHKPDPRVFTPTIAWLKKKGIQPHEVVYIADGLHDMQAAIGAGFHFIGVETGFVTREMFESEKIFSVKHIGEIKHLID